MSWREADERLLRRLEDEARFEALWGALAPPGSAAPHPRASGVLVALREEPETQAALDAADRGDIAPLLKTLHQPDPARLTPRHAHHLALLWGQVADALEGSHAEGAARARRRALGLWLWLAGEQAYLRALAERVIGGGLTEGERALAARDAAFAALDALGERALADAEALGGAGARALAALAAVGEAAEEVDAPDEVRRRATERASRHREAAIDRALTRVEAALEQAVLDGAETAEIVRLTGDALEVWRWAGHDEQVERFLVRGLTGVLWDRYRARDWTAVAAILGPLRDPMQSLARRIDADPTKLAYAGPCAQMLVFMAEVAPQLDEQLALAEEAVRLCEAHRNGRLVLADLLVERALRRLDRAVPLGFGTAAEDAAADIRRAQELFPQLKRLDAAKRRLADKGIVLDAD